jgi:hypothetical protein
MIGTTDAVAAFYRRLHADGPHTVRAAFASVGMCIRGKTALSAIGPRVAPELLYSWRSSFEMLQVGDPVVELADDLRHIVPDALLCFTIRIAARGAYTRTIGGLERLARAHGSRVSFDVKDIMWVNDSGKILRVINSFQLGALKIA